jgi:biotin transport system substrate-specific component
MTVTTGMAYADVFRPEEQNRGIAYDVTLVLAGSLLLALSAQIAFPLPFSPVPVTGQTFAVLMLAALYGRKRGVATMLAYLGEGAAGLPVFAQGLSGPAVLSGPTGGYLAGFVAAAFVVGWLAEMGWDRRSWTTFLAMVIGNLVIYAFGVTWLTHFLGMSGAIDAGLTPFLVGDLAKILLAMVALPAGWRILLALRGE